MRFCRSAPLCFYPRIRLDAGGFRTLWAARVQNALGVMRPISRTVRPLIGPRPERPQFVDLFGERIERYDDRHRVKSGVTAWAQVSAPSR
jgi:hypothetical protein